MSGITLTDDEAAALREVLAALSVIEERGLRHDYVIEITRETWRDLLLRPAARLRRVASHKRIVASTEPSAAQEPTDD